MAKKLASDMNVYYGSYNFGTATTSVSIALEAKSLDPTAITDTAERILGGIRGDSITWGGLFDDATSVDVAAAALVPTGTAIFSVLIGSAVGGRAFSGSAYYMAGKAVSALADLVKYEVVFKPDQVISVGVHYGQTLAKPSTAVVNSGTLDNGTLSVAGGVGYIHVLSITSGTIGCALQDSATGTLWTDLTGARITGAGGTSIKVAISGTLNRYTKFTMEGTGVGTAVGILSRL